MKGNKISLPNTNAFTNSDANHFVEDDLINRADILELKNETNNVYEEQINTINKLTPMIYEVGILMGIICDKLEELKNSFNKMEKEE